MANKYCVVIAKGWEAGSWFKKPGQGVAGLREEVYEHTWKEATQTVRGDSNKRNLLTYRKEDVLTDAIGCAYVKRGAKPVRLR